MSDPDDVRLVADRWLRRAVDDLEAAKLVLQAADRIGPWVGTFHAQQAAEKAMKALLVRDQVPFPKTHDLERLHGLLPANAGLPAVTELAALSGFAVDSRYPDVGLGREPDREDALGAVDVAGRVVDAVRESLG